MLETAVAQLPRLVELVAWMSQSDSDKPVSYSGAARRFGTSPDAVRADVDALVALSDEFKPWLASLSIGFEARGFVVQSRGSFRRPVRFTGDESLALVLGLTGVRGGRALAAKLGALLAGGPHPETVESTVGIGPEPGEHLQRVLALARQARDERRKLEINYCGSGAEPARRVVQVHQVVHAQGRWYVVSWCEKVSEFRHFRADRVLDARLLGQDFRPQVLFRPIRAPEDLLRADAPVLAKVAFSPRIARWLEERYPDGQERQDGRYVVTFKVADPAWFAREVLQYGAEAEVLEPESLRQAVKAAILGECDPHKQSPR